MADVLPEIPSAAPKGTLPTLTDYVAGAYGPRTGMTNFRPSASDVGGPADYVSHTAGLTLASFESTTPTARIGSGADNTALAANGVPSIKVQLEDGAAPPRSRPTATIQTDGSVVDSTGAVVVDKTGTVLNSDFLAKPPLQADLTIGVARDGQATAPNEAQQKVLDKLTDIWGQGIQNAYGDKLATIQTADGQNIKQVKVEDPQNLVSTEEKERLGTGIPPERLAAAKPPDTPEIAPTPENLPDNQISPSASDAAGRVNQAFPQGGQGETRVSDTRQYYPPRTRANDEGSDSDYLNMLSALARQPVDHARHVTGGQRFGMYDTGPRTFGTWMTGFIPQDILDKLGHPPDWSKLAELMKDPKLLKEMQDALKAKGAPADLQANFANPEAAQKFGEFAGKIMTGKGDISAADMKKFMPEALQSKIALDTVRGQKAAGANPSDIALGYQLDKPAKELTAQERDSKEGKAITAASNRLYLLSHAREGAGNDDHIRWTGDKVDPNTVAFRLIHNAQATMDGTAYGCVRSHVANMQRTFGFTPHGNAFDNFKDTWRHLEGTGKFDLIRVTSESQLRPGDIFGVPWTDRTTREMGWGTNAGHVGTIGTGGVEYSQKAYGVGMIFSGRYDTSQLYVIRAKTTNSQA